MRFKYFALIVFFFVLSMFSVSAQSGGGQNGSYYTNSYQELIGTLPAGIPDYKNTKNQTMLDLPFVVGIGNFYFIVTRLEKMITYLCSVFCFLCIVFSCFKLWAGTIEVKKMFVDIIYKCITCFIFIQFFVPATNWVVDMASWLGSRITGGYEKIDNTYKTVHAIVAENIEKGLPPILEAYAENAQLASDGKKYLDASVIQQLKAVGMDESKIDQWAKQEGVDFAEARYRAGSENSFIEWYDKDGKKLQETKSFLFIKWNSDIDLSKQSTNISKIVDKKLSGKEQRTWVVKLNALLQVMTAAEIDEDTVQDGGTGEAVNYAKKMAKKVFYDPYLVDKNGKKTEFFAPGALLKTVLLMGDVVSYAVSSDLDENGKLHAVEFNPKGVWTFDGLVKMLVSMIYKFLCWLATVFIIVEYIMTILEFYLVRGLAMFLIPMFFIDATKPFAQNLIRILISYFFKILTVITTCFFAFGMYLDTQLFVFQYANDLSSMLTLVMYVSTIMMGVVFVMGSGKIAGTVLSGNPSMGIGDVANAVRSGMRTAHAIGHGVQMGARGLKTAHTMGQAGVRGMMSAGAVMGAGLDAASDTVASLNGDKSYKGGSGRTIAAGAGAFLSTAGAAVKQGAADKGYKFLTGKERQHLDAEGKLGTDDRFMGLGAKSEQKDGMHNSGRQNATYGDMRKGADSVAEQKKKNAVEWAKAGSESQAAKKAVRDVAKKAKSHMKAGHAESIRDLHDEMYDGK